MQFTPITLPRRSASWGRLLIRQHGVSTWNRGEVEPQNRYCGADIWRQLRHGESPLKMRGSHMPAPAVMRSKTQPICHPINLPKALGVVATTLQSLYLPLLGNPHLK